MLQKNLDKIVNNKLINRLNRISDAQAQSGISYCVTPSNDYILLKNDVPIDDLNNPRAAIRENFKQNIKSDMKKNDIIINFGIGLGYLLDETFNTYSSKIFIYEPDIELLKFVLANVDISEHLASGRVFIYNDLDELVGKLSEVYLTQDKIEIIYLKNYAVVKNKELIMLTQKVYDACKSKMVDINTITKFSTVWLKNSIDNLAYTKENNTYKLSDLEQKFVGQTALILCAGPSLQENIEKIKTDRNKYVIFAVNKIVRYLLQNDIIPDFVVCLDAKNMLKTLGGLNDYLNNINCIADIRTDSAITSFNFKNIFFNFSNSDTIMQKITKFDNSVKLYEVGGTASTLALIAAIKMGFSTIVFSGLDLAFKDNIIYGTGETMNRISQEKIIVDDVPKNIVSIKSVTGSTVYTREDYAAFVSHFESIIKSNPNSVIYNTTPFGAMIEGCKNIKFNSLSFNSVRQTSSVENCSPIKLELQKYIDEEYVYINEVIALLAKNVFSPALVSAIIKSSVLYQYLQADIVIVLQSNFKEHLAEDFVNKTKSSIKEVVGLLQKINK